MAKQNINRFRELMASTLSNIMEAKCLVPDILDAENASEGRKELIKSVYERFDQIESMIKNIALDCEDC